MHGLQGHPYRTWSSKPANYEQDRKGKKKNTILHRAFHRTSKSSGKNTSKVESQTGQHEGRGNSDDDVKIAIGAAEPFRKEDIYWPLDLLAENCPQACISVYGYDTSIVGYSRVNKDTMFQIATNFFHQLPLHRTLDLPIIFIAHSLGGLVVKEVISLDHMYRKSLQ